TRRVSQRHAGTGDRCIARRRHDRPTARRAWSRATQAAGEMSVGEGTDTSLPTVRACLMHARSRARLGSVLRGAVWSLLLGLIVLCTLEATSAFLNWRPTHWLPALSGTPLLNHLALSAIAFAGAFAIAVLLTFLLAPDFAAL